MLIRSLSLSPTPLPAPLPLSLSVSNTAITTYSNLAGYLHPNSEIPIDFHSLST